MKKTLIVLKRIGLTLLCIFIYSLVMEALKAKGIQLGFVPTAILSFPVFYFLFRIWAKRPQPMKERPEADLYTATNDAVRMMPPPEQIDEPAPSEQSNYAGGTGGKRNASKSNRVVAILLLFLLAVVIGNSVYCVISISSLKKQVIGQNDKLEAMIVAYNEEIASLNEKMVEDDRKLQELQGRIDELEKQQSNERYEALKERVRERGYDAYLN